MAPIFARSLDRIHRFSILLGINECLSTAPWSRWMLSGQNAFTIFLMTPQLVHFLSSFYVGD